MSEQTVRDDLKARMAEVTLATLPEFITYALQQGSGYGEICVAIGAIAAAAAKAADRSPEGGITGFQAGAVFWEFVKFWGVFTPDAPLRVVDFGNMLYPQYDHKFDKTITPETWQWLQEQAAKLLAESNGGVNRNVKSHWQRIAKGDVPFGYEVREG